jgi:hypothetical protein
MQIPDDLVLDFKDTLNQLTAQMVVGNSIKNIHLHLVKKLDAIINQDYKALYHLEREWNKSLTQEPRMTNPGYGYFIDESVILGEESNATPNCKRDCFDSCGCLSPIEIHNQPSAFIPVTKSRINLERY